LICGRELHMRKKRPLKERIREGRGMLCDLSGKDFGYDLAKWHEHFKESREGGYTWGRHIVLPKIMKQALARESWRKAVAELQKEEEQGGALVGGREKREIVICDYDPIWPRVFQLHAKVIAMFLGGAALRVEHIGSTSVEGLAAKPIIDVLVVVADSADEASYLPKMEEAGYELRVREPDFHEHRMFRRPDRSVHVHVYSEGSPEIERYLTFRDRLRSSSPDRERYERAKRELAGKSWPDMNAYAEAKTAVVEEIIAAARAAGEVSR
jgi:GrpB-like predicted nucleotidyltransferase (UPF0157 family)